jgi:acid stress-induced BolA-like protein IbaG/YrbA
MSDHGMDETLHNVMPEPSLRMIIAGPTGAGKGRLVSELLLKHYRGAFSKIYYFSASALLDDNLKPIRKYCEKYLGQGEKDPCLYDSWDEAVIENILARQMAVCAHVKKRGSKRKFHIAIICDDFADDRKVVRSGLIEKIFCKGRHANVSCFVLTQYYRLLSPVLRCQQNVLAVFRLRNLKDKQAIIEENSAIVDQKVLNRMYDMATGKPWGFLLIMLTETDPNKMFYSSLNARLIPS